MYIHHVIHQDIHLDAHHVVHYTSFIMAFIIPSPSVAAHWRTWWHAVTRATTVGSTKSTR